MTTLHIATLSAATMGSPSPIDDDREPDGDHPLAAQLLHQFADRSTSAFWILDIQAMRILYRNAAFLRMLGHAEDAVRHLGAWQALVHPEDRHARTAALARMRNGEAFSHDYRIIRGGGAVRVIHETCFPVVCRADSPSCAGGICEDITTEELPTVYLVDTVEGSDAYMRTLRAAGYDVRRFDSVAALLRMSPVLLPGCLVLNAQRHDAAMLGTVAGLRASRADMPLVMLGDCGGDVGVAVEAMKAGAVDFLQTPVTPQALLGAVAAGVRRLKETVVADNTAELTRAHVAAMTVRERQVLDGLLASGTNKSIGRDLGLSPRTVEAHRGRIMNRLGARSLAEAILMVAAAGIVTTHGDAGSGDRSMASGGRVRPA